MPRRCGRCCWRRWPKRDSLAAERDALAERNERLQHLLLKLRRMQFGPSSERLPEDQLQFAFEELEAAIASNDGRGREALADLRKKNAARRRAGRGRLPAHLPRIEQVLCPRHRLPVLPGRRWSRSACDTAERLT